MSFIHSTAQIDPKAKIGKGVKIGPFCVIGADVTLGEGTELRSHNYIEGPASIGRNNIIGSFCHIGARAYHLLASEEDDKALIEIGDNNFFGTGVNINRGMMRAGGITRVGNNCTFFDRCMISHDCLVGDNVVMTSTNVIAGHVVIESHVMFGGITGAKQFTRIGEGAMITSFSGLDSDVLPFFQISVFVSGGSQNRAVPRSRGINVVGMRRRGIATERIRLLQKFTDQLRNLSPEMGGMRARLSSIKAEAPNTPEVESIYRFAEDKSRVLSLVDFSFTGDKVVTPDKYEVS